jgi:hypothetical protein
LTWALELLSYARNRLKCKPQFVLFDSWYPAKALLKRIGDYGWYFVCRLKERERFDQGMSRRQFKWHLILKRSQVPLPALERVRMAA